jgi:hypothetical protein
MVQFLLQRQIRLHMAPQSPRRGRTPILSVSIIDLLAGTYGVTQAPVLLKVSNSPVYNRSYSSGDLGPVAHKAAVDGIDSFGGRYEYYCANRNGIDLVNVSNIDLT